MSFNEFIQNYDVVVWDWNGTLLDDVQETHQVIENILIQEGLSPISVDEYRQHFGFPISSYYASLGLPSSGQDFDRVAHQFISSYKAKQNQLSLFEDSLDLLKSIKSQGIQQYVLSAAQSADLHHLLNHFEISDYFNHISGADDIYAHGKIGQAQSMKVYFERQGYQKGVYIGDTDHDFEVSQVLGFDFCFSAKGHQSSERLKKSDMAYILRDT